MMFAIVTDTMALVALVMLAQGGLLITALVAPLMTALVVTAIQAPVGLAMMAPVAPRMMVLVDLFTAGLAGQPITAQAALVMPGQAALPIMAPAAPAIQGQAAMEVNVRAFADSVQYGIFVVRPKEKTWSTIRILVVILVWQHTRSVKAQ